MPSRKATNSSPVKGAVNDELIDLPWCVTDRLGLYVMEYSGGEPVTANKPNDVLSRMGSIRGVSWSGVWTYEGTQINVFKLEVYMQGYEDDDEVIEPQTKMFVVTEENFQNFSDEEWRSENLAQDEQLCKNVDQELIDAWVVSTRKHKNGQWFKKWYNLKRGETAQSAQPARTQARLAPPVFGVDSVSNPINPAALQERQGSWADPKTQIFGPTRNLFGPTQSELTWADLSTDPLHPRSFLIGCLD